MYNERVYCSSSIGEECVESYVEEAIPGWLASLKGLLSL